MDQNPNRNPIKLHRIAPWIFWIIFFTLLYWVWTIYQIYVFPFFIALISYLIFRKPYFYLLRLFKDRRSLASGVASAIIVLIIVIPAFLLIRTLIREIIIAVNYAQNWLTRENLYQLYEQNEWIRLIIAKLNIKMDSIQEKLLQITTNMGSVILKQGREILSGIFSILFNFLISMVSLFFLFREGDKISPFIYEVLPFPDEIEAKVGARLLEVLDIMVRGTLMISLAQGFILGVYFWMFGLSTPILYGSLAAFFSLVPILGTTAVWLPGSIYLYLTGDFLSAVVLGILSFATYLILENIVKPWLLDKKLPLHPLFLFLAILGGVTQFGIQGFILGPFVVTAFLIILELMKAWSKEYGKN